jgi:iron complex transport system permease protein
VISRRRVVAASLVVTGGLVIAGLAGLAVGPPPSARVRSCGRSRGARARISPTPSCSSSVSRASSSRRWRAPASQSPARRFQALTRNPLADPAVLGVAGGAALGAVLGHLWGFQGTLAGAVGLSAAAFAGALVAAIVVYVIASAGGSLRSRRSSWPG